MYNLYIYEKQLSEKQRQKSEELKNNKLKEKRKLQIKKLFSNYCKRMDKFIISLNRNPIIIHDPPTPINCRQINNFSNKSFNQNNNCNKNFIFGGFMTDRKRIELLNEEKNLIKKYEEKIMKSKKSKAEQKSDEKIIVQPRMRFKPRTELERIIEMMDLLGNKNKKFNKIIFEQLQKLDKLDINAMKNYSGFRKFKKMFKNQKDNNFDTPSTSKNIEKDEEMNKKENNGKKDNNSNVNKKNNDSNNDNEEKNKNKDNEIKLQSLNDDKKKEDEDISNFEKMIKLKNKILKELFKDEQKMHFKGASQYALNERYIINKNNNKNNFSLIKNKLKYNRTNSALNQTNYKFKNFQKNIKNRYFRPVSFCHKKLPKKDDNISPFNDISDIAMKFGDNPNKLKKKMNNVLKEEVNHSLFFDYINKYKYNFKNIKNNKDNNYILNDTIKDTENEDDNLQEKLNYLKKIIEKKDIEEKEEMKRFSDIKGFQNKKNKNLVKYYIKTKKEKNKNDIDEIKINVKDIIKNSDEIFRKCNYYHPKSCHSKRRLIEGNGKLSCTSGLTIKDFSIKYNL